MSLELVEVLEENKANKCLIVCSYSIFSCVKFLMGICTGLFNFCGNASDCYCVSIPLWLPSLPCLLPWIYVSVTVLTGSYQKKIIQKDDLSLFPFQGCFCFYIPPLHWEAAKMSSEIEENAFIIFCREQNNTILKNTW